MKYIYLLLSILILTSCGSGLNPEVEASKMDYSYLALGDSYTIGESVSEKERWPVQLAAQLNERGVKVAPPKIIAKTGWTTANLIEGINTEINVQRDFDLVSISIGVNNQYQGKSINDYETELREVFRKAINHSKHLEKGVFALSIPDYGVTPFGQARADIIRAEINEFNEVFRRVAEDFNVAFYNITPISREAKNKPQLIAGDGLHPSGLMYKEWVDLIVEDIKIKLTEN